MKSFRSSILLAFYYPGFWKSTSSSPDFLYAASSSGDHVGSNWFHPHDLSPHSPQTLKHQNDPVSNLQSGFLYLLKKNMNNTGFII